MRRALIRMVASKMAMAFTRWRETAADGKQQEMAMRRAVGRMINGKLAAALSTWPRTWLAPIRCTSSLVSACIHFNFISLFNATLCTQDDTCPSIEDCTPKLQILGSAYLMDSLAAYQACRWLRAHVCRSTALPMCLDNPFRSLSGNKRAHWTKQGNIQQIKSEGNVAGTPEPPLNVPPSSCELS